MFVDGMIGCGTQESKDTRLQLSCMKHLCLWKVCIGACVQAHAPVPNGPNCCFVHMLHHTQSRI